MISKMKKLTVAAVQSDMDALAKELVWLSCVETVPLEEFLEEHPDPSYHDGIAAELAEVQRQMAALKDAVETLAPLGSGRGKKSFFTLPELFERNEYEKLSDRLPDALALAEKINALTKQESQKQSELNHFQSEISMLEPLARFDIPLGLTETKATELIVGTIPKSVPVSDVQRFVQENGQDTPCDCVIGAIETMGESTYLYAVVPKQDVETLIALLNAKGFTRLTFKGYDKTAREEIARIEAVGQTVRREMEAMEEQKRQYAQERDALEKGLDYLQSQLATLQIKQRLFSTQSTLLLQGWVPERRVHALTEMLKRFDVYYEIDDPQVGDEPPTELINNRFATPFESVIALYSYPAYRGYDPTFFMSVFYFVIFGLIMADVGYGLLLLIGCGLFLKWKRPKGNTRKMLQMFAICGISTAAAGILFGSFFGDLPSAIAVNMFGVEQFPNFALLFNPIENPIGYLVLSLALGAVHLVTGMLIKAYMLVRDGHALDAVFDVGLWLLLFAGIGVLFLRPEVGKWIAVAAIAGLILTQGRAEKNIIMKFLKGVMSLYDIVSYVSDLLSYSRILALGLSGAIISSVVNIIGTLGGNSIVGFLCLIIAFVLGHTLNIALSMLGAFVHTARLQYIEFFNKFYIDGGKVFAPSSIQTKYIELKHQEGNKS